MKTIELSENARQHIGASITIRWGTSRGRDSYGYTTCSLRNQHGKRVAACNGGGYDMRGTVLGNWITYAFTNELRAIKPDDMPKGYKGEERQFYGLRFYDPSYNPANAVLEHADGTFTKSEDVGKTLGQLHKEGKLVELDAIRASYKQSSPHATERHTAPSIDGACGESSVLRILNAIGLYLERVHSSSKLDIYVIREVQS